MKKIAVLLINVGTPDSPALSDVRRYLSEFLNDKRVITLPFFLRKILVNGIIIPFRARKSSNLYKNLWTEKGSALLHYSIELKNQLQNKFKEDYKIYFGMRYGNPSLIHTLKQIKEGNPDEIIILPLYPQYASSTTGSAFEAVFNELKNWNAIPSIKLIHQFYKHPEFITTYVNQILKYDPKDYDHIIFSYHGLPLSHIDKVHSSVSNDSCDCINEMPEHGKLCYKAACYETTRLIVKALGLTQNEFSIGFQSRLSNKWLNPFTDQIIKNLAQKGVKKILVVAPSFVTDCLETIIEIQHDYKELFIKKGGEKLTLVSSLNDSDEWLNSLFEIIKHQ